MCGMYLICLIWSRNVIGQLFRAVLPIFFEPAYMPQTVLGSSYRNVHELATCRTYIEMYMNLHDFLYILPV